MSDSMVLQDLLGVADSTSNEIFHSPKSGSLTKAQGLVLLAKLANDEGFRSRFEQMPAQALSEIGIPAEQITRLRTECLNPRVLASKSVLEDSRQRLAADLDTSVLAFIVQP